MTINIQVANIPDINPLSQWVELPLAKPEKDSVGYILLSDNTMCYAQIIDNILYVNPKVKEFGAIKGTYIPSEKTIPVPFVLSDWISNDITEIMPSFELTYTEIESGETKIVLSNELKFSTIPVDDTTDSITSKSKENNIKISFSSTFVFKGVPLVIRMQSAMYTMQDIIPFYATIEYNSADKIKIESLIMRCREEVVIDDRRIHGLESSYIGGGTWASEILLDQVMPSEDKAFSGALLCRSAKGFDRNRLLTLKARANGRLTGGVI